MDMINSSLTALNALATKISPGVVSTAGVVTSTATSPAAVNFKNGVGGGIGGDLIDLKQQFTASKTSQVIDTMR